MELVGKLHDEVGAAEHLPALLLRQPVRVLRLHGASKHTSAIRTEKERIEEIQNNKNL